MTELIKNCLSSGYIPDEKAVVYVPGSGKARIKSMRYANEGAAGERLQLWFFDGTTELQLLDEVLAPDAVKEVPFEALGFSVPYGGCIRAQTDTAGKVSYKISGTVETESYWDSELWYPPDVAHRYDDEFADADLGSEWGVWTSGTAGSFSFGTVNVYDNTFTTGTVLRANPSPPTRRSWLVLQPPGSGGAFFMHKSVPLAENMLVWARLKFLGKISIANGDVSCALCLFEDDGSGGLTNNHTDMYINEADAGEYAAQFQRVESGTFDLRETANSSAQGTPLEYAALHKVGSVVHGYVGTRDGNWLYMNSTTPGVTYSRVAFLVQGLVITGAPVLGIDFVRFIETDNFLL